MTKATDGDDFEVSPDSKWKLVQQTQYDRDGRHDLTTTIITTVADAEGVAPTELQQPVLYECVNVSALEDAFFGPEVKGQTRDSVGSAEFDYGGYRVARATAGFLCTSVRSPHRLGRRRSR
ncbi:HalOD1 output domain-containing protein [Haladaptatus sp. NG-WS-4]